MAAAAAAAAAAADSDAVLDIDLGVAPLCAVVVGGECVLCVVCVCVRRCSGEGEVDTKGSVSPFSGALSIDLAVALFAPTTTAHRKAIEAAEKPHDDKHS